MKTWHKRCLFACVAVVVLLLLMSLAQKHLLANYAALESVTMRDRSGVVLTMFPNSKGAYGTYNDAFPQHVRDLVVQKEDRFFYVHPGVNPLSIIRALARRLMGHRMSGASTITQQLVKNLLGNEQDRSIGNKLRELFFAVSLDLFTPKAKILSMYENSVYMGNQVQGLAGASELYFHRKLADLDDTKLAMLLAALASPSTQNPWRPENATASRNLAKRLGLHFDPKLAIVTPEHDYAPVQNFELASMHMSCTTTCRTTLDADLTDRLRTMLDTRVQQGWDAGARSGAIVVVKLPENELLALVGTPDPSSSEGGQQINMTLQPRPIGSTAKPFIYLQGFAKGLRPYTLVDDREYKFPIGNGFPLYPKNYDGKYRGWITLHSALSNSLNVPTVKVLQYIGLTPFYDFLEHSLGFRPKQDLDAYQYGIALGALEMDPLTLAQYLTLFPQQGVLKPLRLFLSGMAQQSITTPMSQLTGEKKVAEPALTELVTKVLHDRLTGVQQFGLASNLNLSQSNYAVKTGTSQDYHDSWTVGYTPDFLVVVWYGNPDNKPLHHVTGQSGAGGIWHDTMEMLINSPYNKRTPMDFSRTQDFAIDRSLDFGLPSDVVAEHRNLLPDNALIMSPQDGDTFLFAPTMSIPLRASNPLEQSSYDGTEVAWYANGEYLGQGTELRFTPREAGDYKINAVAPSGASQVIHLHVKSRS